MENYQWNCGIKEMDTTDNKIRNVVKTTFIKELKKMGFAEIDLPVLDYSEKYILNNEYFSAQNHYKTVAPNGEVLSISDDVVPALVSFSRQEIDTKGRLCASSDERSFLSREGISSSNYQFAGVIYGDSDFMEEADLLLVAKNFAEEIGINGYKIVLGNTNIFRGVLNVYAKREESVERLKNILNGQVNNDVDYAVSQSIAPIKNVEGDAGLIKELAVKLDNKQSIDGLLDVFEISNVMKAYNLDDKLIIKPSYLGRKRYDNGMVFVLVDGKGREIVYGGRCDCVKGSDQVKCLYVKVDTNNALCVAKENGIEENIKSNTVLLAVAPTIEALAKSYKVRNDFAKENLCTKIMFNVDSQEAYALMGKAQEGIVLYIDQEGNITHS